MLAITDSGEVVDVNDAAADLLGKNPVTVRQESIGQFVDGLDGERLKAHVIAATRSPGPWSPPRASARVLSSLA